MFNIGEYNSTIIPCKCVLIILKNRRDIVCDN